ncbi:hypothetical protein NCAS_0F00380 [Naumovozyma castellii]|uniref:Uncharacterized protein n=1 Tax=Naumovozyma castellii TaxID=27288 RepID=G0VGA2_NAUCA|nr:hypothetical protein NCAS_0F00380 [Naumovozyma castellii CBS 4309]CCC70522.1 hypothetical protein NCAS_0F00380 [Naumovozyma castellii CBS 4309]
MEKNNTYKKGPDAMRYNGERRTSLSEDNRQKMSKRVSYTIEGPIFIIKLNDPRHLNSLTFDDFVYIAMLLEKANSDDSIFITVLQSSAKFFSSGGKFEAVLESKGKEDDIGSLNNLIGMISSPNVFVANAFRTHEKLLVCCLNGPAVGLSACIVMLCDLVYARDDSVYLLFPFSNLGFVAEVGSSVTLPMKLGINKANEHLLFSKPLTFADLQGKLINKNYQMEDTDEFNKQVVRDLQAQLVAADAPLRNMKAMKRQITEGTGYRSSLLRAQGLETMTTLPFWHEGEPFRRFEQMRSKQRKHKL